MLLSANSIEVIIHHLKGGFAPLVILLREFHVEKINMVLPGLHFSAYTLLRHMQHRQKVLLTAMKQPPEAANLWPEAQWPSTELQPDATEWAKALEEFEQTIADFIQEFKSLSAAPESDLKEHAFNCSLICLHHNAYHIGQLKAIGRQLGVW